MQRRFLSLAFPCVLTLRQRARQRSHPGNRNIPRRLKGDAVDDYHGTKVADPYRWLEDPDSPESRHWIDAENKLTFQFLDAIPQRAAIKARLKELWDYERYGVPFKEQSRYFFTKNSGLQNQSVVFTTDCFCEAAARVDRSQRALQRWHGRAERQRGER